MNKILVNKETLMVEQIICLDDGCYYPGVDAYGSWFFEIDDPEHLISSYNMRYNEDIQWFEVDETYVETETKIDEPVNLEALKQENEKLKADIMMMQLALDDIIMNLL